MAAETPQIETAEARMAENSSSTPSRRASQKAKAPHHEHHHESLQDAGQTRLDDLTEEHAGAQDDEPDLDVEFGASARSQPGRDLDGVLDHEPRNREPRARTRAPTPRLEHCRQGPVPGRKADRPREIRGRTG